MTPQHKKEWEESDDDNQKEYSSSSTNEIAKGMLSQLLKSMTIEEAESAMRELLDSIESSSSSNRKRLVQVLVRHNGSAAIVVALEKYFQFSQDFCLAALSVLVNITYYEPQKSNPILVGIGGIHTLLRTSTFYNMQDVAMVSDTVELLCNFATLSETRPEVATEECIDFVFQAMLAFPEDEDTQLEGCEYFLAIGELSPKTKELVKSKRIGSLLGNALDNFQDPISQNAMIWYAK
jgi:hypothetical protein